MPISNPALEAALYATEPHYLPEVIEKYCNLLLEENFLGHQLHVKKLREYRSTITNAETISVLKKIFNSFSMDLIRKFPYLKFRIAARRKSFLSMEEKILLYLKQNSSLDSIRDTLGVRIILFSPNIEDCYSVLELLSNTCEFLGFKKCEGTYKDYIKSPKTNGYRSLHLVFTKKLEGAQDFSFEVQVRNFEMHCEAASGKASHAVYKDVMYGDTRINFKPDRVNIHGFGIASNGNIVDLVGLYHSVELFQMNNLF